MPSGLMDVLGDIQGVQNMLKKKKPGAPGMASPPSFARGGKVKRSGLAMVHKGETVTPKGAMNKDRVGSAMGGSKSKSKGSKGKKGGKHVHEMHIRHAANGGYIARHDFKQQPGAQQQPQEPEEHALPDMNSLSQHVQDNMVPMQQQPQAA